MLGLDSGRTALRPRGANFIAHELSQAIAQGVYAQGQQLPTERELATTFGTSRTTVRKALSLIEAKHLVQRRAGSGTYVAQQRTNANDSGITERTSPLQLIEVRSVIEPQMARLAVLHASQIDLDRLHGLVRELETAEKTKDSVAYARADEQFHLAIASATSNPLMVWLYEQINVIRTHSQWAEMRQKIITVDNMHLYNIQHAAVVRAIASRDASAAAETMVRHMDKARLDLIGAQSR